MKNIAKNLRMVMKAGLAVIVVSGQETLNMTK